MSAVATSPHDPQASLGFNKCMDALKRMDVVWPSAGRAWELLDGAKDGLREYEPEGAIVARPRKRSAEDQLDSAIPADHSPHEYARPAPHVNAHGYPMQASNPYHSPNIDLVDSESPLAFFTSYDRWSSDNSMGLPSGLSTSVLPQQYSTGFVDERMHRPHVGGMMDYGSRYPQYWSDYASLGQPSSILGSTYGMALMPGQIPQEHPQHPPQGPQQPQDPRLHGQGSMYMGDHFNMF